MNHAAAHRARHSNAPPLALYVHFPWCVKKCPYCDFNSHARRGEIDQRGYINALLKDLDYDLAAHDGARPLGSIFMGGGTPSLFSGAAIHRLLREIGARCAFEEGMEITLEANPGAVEHDDFAAYREAGVNRLSLGVQSFHDAQLQALGRVHNATHAQRAMRAARDAGFANINLDLMYGAPQQTAASAARDVAMAVEFLPSHLSLYQLTLEPNTWFHRHPPTLPDEVQLTAMQRRLQALVGRHGYQQYEVSAYARRGMRCRHNLNYWRFGDYLGIGAGAHAKITERGAITRYWKHKHPRRYLETAGGAQCRGETKRVGAHEALFEFLLNGLRLRDGVETALIHPRTGRTAEQALALLSAVRAQKLVEISGNGSRIKCSAHGYRFLDDILQQLLPTAE